MPFRTLEFNVNPCKSRQYKKQCYAKKGVSRMGFPVKHFAYAAIDCLLGQDGRIWLLEANDSPAAPYFITLKNRWAFYQLSERERVQVVNCDQISCFVDHLVRYYVRLKGEMPIKIGIAVDDLNEPEWLMLEKIKIKEAMEHRGIKVSIFDRNGYEIRNGILVLKSDFVPDLIYRRAFTIPSPNIRQVVVNDMHVRKYGGNKLETYMAVAEFQQQMCSKTILIPRWDIAQTLADIPPIVERYTEVGKECLIKPVDNYGGKGIFFFRNRQEAEELLQYERRLLQQNLPYLVQERIYPQIYTGADDHSYIFDFRVMVYDGVAAGVEARRAPLPADANTQKSKITNISAGGSDVAVAIDETVESIGSIRLDYKEFFLSLDSNVLTISTNLWCKLKDVAEQVVRAVDEKIQRVTSEERRSSHVY